MTPATARPGGYLIARLRHRRRSGTFRSRRRAFLQEVAALRGHLGRRGAPIAAASFAGGFVLLRAAENDRRHLAAIADGTGVLCSAGWIPAHLETGGTGGDQGTLRDYVRRYAIDPGPRPVTVAVMDTGIDYTHRLLGGDGTEAAFARAYGLDPQAVGRLRAQAVRGRAVTPPPVVNADRRHDADGTYFPTSVVVAGADFVGETWDGHHHLDEVVRANPMDVNGHGTGVAGIIHAIAPQAKLVAVKVGASYSRNVSFSAIATGLDYCLDPFETGDLCPVDIVNMSFGIPGEDAYEALHDAVEQLEAYGVMCVAAEAGDDAGRRLAPAASPSCLAVAAGRPLDDSHHTLRLGGATHTLLHQWFSPPRPDEQAVLISATPEPDAIWVTAVSGTVAQTAGRAYAAGAAGCIVVSDGLAQFDNEEWIWPTAPTFVSDSQTLLKLAGERLKGIISGGAAGPRSSGHGPGPESADLTAAEGMPCAVAATGTRMARHEGSSSAAPIVAGLAANLLSHNPGLTARAARYALLNSADHSGAPATPGARPAGQVEIVLSPAEDTGDVNSYQLQNVSARPVEVTVDLHLAGRLTKTWVVRDLAPAAVHRFSIPATSTEQCAVLSAYTSESRVCLMTRRPR